jgi:hypothetical protein
MRQWDPLCCRHDRKRVIRERPNHSTQLMALGAITDTACWTLRHSSFTRQRICEWIPGRIQLHAPLLGNVPRSTLWLLVGPVTETCRIR